MVDLERRKRARLDIDPSLNFVSSDESDNESLCSLSSHGFSQTEMQVRGNPGPPNSFLCPISQDVMFDPVLDAEGNSFDRQALIGWLQEHRTSPISGKPLCDRMVVPNKALREAIHEYMGRQWVTRKMFQTRRVSFEEETELSSDASDEDISPIRAKINCFLQEHTSHVLGGLDLRLNEEGCCAFRHENATVVLDVPESVGVICFYTRDLIPEHIEQSSDRDQLYQKALQMNFLQGETRGDAFPFEHTRMASLSLYSRTQTVLAKLDPRTLPTFCLTSLARCCLCDADSCHTSSKPATRKTCPMADRRRRSCNGLQCRRHRHRRHRTRCLPQSVSNRGLALELILCGCTQLVFINSMIFIILRNAYLQLV